MKALVFIAHGSKKELSNQEFISMVNSIKQKDTNYDFIEASFLELAIPDIKNCSEKLIEKGVKKIYYYPFFLNSGRHVVSDIPNIIEELKSQYTNVEFELLKHFGSSKFIEEIIIKDISKI